MQNLINSHWQIVKCDSDKRSIYMILKKNLNFQQFLALMMVMKWIMKCVKKSSAKKKQPQARTSMLIIAFKNSQLTLDYLCNDYIRQNSFYKKTYVVFVTP